MTNTSRKRGYVPKFVHNKDAKKKKFNNDGSQRSESSQKFGKNKSTKSKFGSKTGGDRRGDRRNVKQKAKK